MTPSQKPIGEKHFIGWIIAVLGVVLVVLLFFLIRQYQTLRHEQIVSARESWLMNALKHHPYLTSSDAGVIRSWMTFDYLNKLFSIPPAYFKAQLSITDPAYPKLTVSKFAKDIGRPASSTLLEVQDSVRRYLASPVLVNTSST